MSSKRSYTLQYKLGVIEWVESTKASLRSAARKYGVDRKMIRNWLLDKERIRLALLMHGPGKRKLHEGRAPKSNELDRMVLDYYLETRRHHGDVANTEIKKKALKIARKLGLTDFKATASWLKCWRSRCGIDMESGHDGMGMEYGNETVATLLRTASTLLSQVHPSDRVDLSGQQRDVDQSVSPELSCDFADDGVYMDYTTAEHNYCKFANHSDNSRSTTSECSHIPRSCAIEANHVMSCDPVLDCHDNQLIDCEVREIDLPLGNEVEIGNFHDIIITLTDSLGNHGNTSHDNRTVSESPIKFKGDSTSSDSNGRSTSPPFFQPLTFDLDDPQGHGGLLASRMLQPVFPDEPEIVYLDMQLGMLHSVH